MGKLFLSHRLDLLAEHLAKELVEDGRGIFAPRTVVVPNSALKQWILIQIANWTREGGIAGCKAMTLQEAVQIFLAPAEFTQIYSSLFSSLTECQNKEIRSYFEQSPRRIVELANRLAGLFIRYGNFCPSLFEPDPTTEHWQRQLIQTLFVSGTLRLPVQMPPIPSTPIHCFGFDYLPPAIWNVFNFRSIYLFSPCCHFWEDLCTDRERKSIGRFWKQKGAPDKKREELDAYLKSAPSLLANWGRAGRETLKILDSFVEEIEEDYRRPVIERNSTLARLANRLLAFHVEEEQGKLQDASIQISKTGSSALREIEHLRESILRLIEKEGLLCSDIAVFAPDIQRYASLIPFVFTDLPYRISGLEIGSKSFFYQGMHLFFKLDSEDLMALFENPSFCRARGWNLEILEQFRKWLFRNQELYPNSCLNIENQLLDQFVYLFPEEKKRISGSSADALEQFIEIYQSLQSDFDFLRQSRTLSDWSIWLTSLMQKYFSADLSDEADAAAWNFFQESMKELKEVDKDGRLFPFAPIQALLKRSIRGGQIHASHLHAIRFASLAEGALTPVRALFLIGMDEENFPRRSSSSSLDLLRSEPMYSFDSVDQDRYLFLQAVFAAREFLHFSYAHLSFEGNPVNPCSLIEELVRSLDAPIQENKVDLSIGNTSSKATVHWPEKPSVGLPQGERTISLSELSSLARHPWEFYLKKQYGIRFERIEDGSFSRQKARILRANLHKPMQDLLSELPLGICGDAVKLDLEESSKEWAKSIRSWDVAIEPVSFRICCKEKKRGENGWEYPSLELNPGPGLHVKLVGEVKTFSQKGFVHTGNDNLEGLLKVWPECLAALVASGRREIYFLKSGKIKTVDQPDQALNAYLLYYFLSQSAPSPLLADWADSILRKGPDEWGKKMNDKVLGKGVRFEDAVWDWVIDRVDLPSADIWFDQWGEPLSEHFSQLTALYPARGKHAVL